MQLDSIEFKTSTAPVPYPEALAFMEQRVEQMIAGQAGPCVWFLEHPPLYTAGTSAKPEDLLEKDRLPVYTTGRGGEYTYHGPGQLVAYVMVDLKPLFTPDLPDLKAYIARLESWIIATLAEFGIEAFIREDMIGVWVDQKSEIRNQKPGIEKMNTTPPASGGGRDAESVSRGGQFERSSVGVSSPQLVLCPPLHPPRKRGGDFFGSQAEKNEAKIAAIGVRVKKWVAYHGICINIHPNLEDYQGIVPCGISEYGVTSLKELGKEVSLEEAMKVMKENIFILSSSDLDTVALQ